jgi:SSS family solute:Na+ symporter
MTYIITIADKAGQKDNSILLRIDPKAKPDNQVKWLWVALTVVMVALYVFFNGH